ncbi:restriction endonuclease subunit S [Clostridiaceae bacterium NSJ-31]|uniref:Restriction endonuclease subunit S n=1 Tax=Ligaoa zhengdingensis TaxID=2763658 RepID=A0A926DZ79_9FIRM|nr:restriction endonuclease subunit S [Ligaoa zhengdingensis]
MIIKIEEVISEYSVRNKSNEDIPVYSVTNEKGFCTGYFSKEVASKDKSTYKIVPKGYFAYNPSRINVGSIDWQKYEARVIVSPLYIVFSVSDRLDQQYLLHYLKSDIMLSFIKEYATGSVRDNLKLSDLGKFPINLRPMEEQRRIAATLDKVSDLIAKRHHQLDKLDELVKSRFIELFGEPMTNPKKWPVYELSKYIRFLTSGSRGWAKYFTDEGEYFITIKNVKNCRITLDDVQYIVPPDNAEAKRTRVQEGDLLISITADLGRTGIVTKEIADYGGYINQHLTCIRLNQAYVRPLYVAYYMESDAGREQFQSKNQSAVKAGLNFNSINTLRLIVPPVELQDTFIAFVEQTDKSKLAIQKSLETLETLKKALMQQYFG